MLLREILETDAGEAAALDPAWTADDYIRVARREFPERFCVVAELEGEGRVAGLVLASLLPPTAEILNIVVAPDMRRRGLGAALMREAARRMTAAGATRVWLEVRASNHAAHQLYKRLGFRLTGRRPRYYQHPQEDALLLESPLPLVLR